MARCDWAVRIAGNVRVLKLAAHGLPAISTDEASQQQPAASRQAFSVPARQPWQPALEFDTDTHKHTHAHPPLASSRRTRAPAHPRHTPQWLSRLLQLAVLSAVGLRLRRSAAWRKSFSGTRSRWPGSPGRLGWSGHNHAPPASFPTPGSVLLIVCQWLQKPPDRGLGGRQGRAGLPLDVTAWEDPEVSHALFDLVLSSLPAGTVRPR